MSQIQTKFLKDLAVTTAKVAADAITEEKVKLGNGGALRARNAANTADVELFKLDGSDKLKLLVLPQVSSDPTEGDDVARKSYIDAQITATGGDLSALQSAFDDFVATKAQPGGLASLDGAGLVPSTQLPSYVDDVLEFANLAAFPATGEQGKIYVAIDTSKCYRWSGSTYIQITSGAVDSVNGQIGIVSLDGSDILSASNNFGGMTIDASLDALQGGIDATGAAVAQEILDREAADALLLPLAGGTMSGDIVMDGHGLFGAGKLEGQYIEVDSATASSIISGTSVTLDAPVVYIANSGSPGTIETNGGAVSAASVTGALFELSDDVGLSFSGANGQVTLPNGTVLSEVGLSFATAGSTISFGPLDGVVDGLAAPVGDQQAANKAYVDAAIFQEVTDRDAAIAVETGRATGAEGALSGRADALEALALAFQPQEKFVLSGTDISNGYVTLSYLAIVESLNVFVDRLAIHGDEDYSISVVGGVTRITFAGSLITPGQEKLSAGDVIRVKGAKLAF